MVILLRRNRIRLLALLMAATAAGILWTAHRDAAAASAAAPARAADGWTIVLDAGHGGEDGGAVSRGGVPESGINLQIAKKMQGLLAFLGRGCVMTRADEAAIYSPEAKTLREKKVSDLKNRVALINGTPGALLVSIHQNSLPSHPSTHGAQVFFNAVDPAERALAQGVQQALNVSLDAGQAPSRRWTAGVYLMKHDPVPGRAGRVRVPLKRRRKPRICRRRSTSGGWPRPLLAGLTAVQYERGTR